MSIPPRPPGPPEDSGDDFIPGTPLPARPSDDSTQALTQDELAELRRRATRRGPATPLDGGDAEATQMLSIEELRELAAETRDPRLDAADAGPTAQKPSRRETREAEEAAQNQAAPASWPLPVTGQMRVTRAGAPQGGERPRAPHFPAAPAEPSTPSPGPVGPPPGRGEPRGRSNRWWIWVVAIVAFLLLATLVVLGARAIALQEPSAAPQTIAPPPPAGTDTGSAAPSQTPSAEAVESFASPTGNITCTIDADRVRCTIASHDFEPPEAPDDCSWEGWGSVLVANDEGAGFSCDENGPEAVSPQTLDYGESISANGMTCTSERTGMSCESDTTGKGFTVSRGAADVNN